MHLWCKQEAATSNNYYCLKAKYSMLPLQHASSQHEFRSNTIRAWTPNIFNGEHAVLSPDEFFFYTARSNLGHFKIDTDNHYICPIFIAMP